MPRSLATVTAVTILATALATSATVQAEEPSSEEAPPPPRRRSYAAETLMSDGISIVTAPFFVGIVGYLVAAPITHLAHQGASHALSSLGLRVLAPLAGATVGGLINAAGSKSPGAGLPGAIVGLGVGVAFAIYVDATVLANEPVKEEEPRLQSRAPGTRLRPMGGVRSEGGFDVGLGGVF